MAESFCLNNQKLSAYLSGLSLGWIIDHDGLSSIRAVWKDDSLGNDLGSLRLRRLLGLLFGAPVSSLLNLEDGERTDVSLDLFECSVDVLL